MVINSEVFSLRFDLQGIRNDDEEDDLVDLSLKQVSIPNTQVEISHVFHCDGLLLCVTSDNSKLLVWNPYLGQTKWIHPINNFQRYDCYALGYDNNNHHKILRFCNDNHENNKGIDVYDFSSDSWRVLDVNHDGDPPFYYSGVSLKGNTYFFGQELTTVATQVPSEREVTSIEDYLLCFDFTTERFGPRLPLPFHPDFPSFEAVTLSWARDDKLAVLYNHEGSYEMIEICIATKIDPNAVSWTTFLTLDTRLFNGLQHGFSTNFEPRSFFIDEEKKVVVLFDIDSYNGTNTCSYQMAYIIGEGGNFKSINLGKAPNPSWRSGQLVCSSYVPSLVKLQV